jgi:hypothetical protein
MQRADIADKIGEYVLLEVAPEYRGADDLVDYGRIAVALGAQRMVYGNILSCEDDRFIVDTVHPHNARRRKKTYPYDAILSYEFAE